MSAAELIEQIKSLPGEDQDRVLDFLQSVRGNREEARYATDAQFDQKADKVLREHSELFRRLATERG